MLFEQRSAEGRLVWVTRTAPYNRLTGRHVRIGGHEPVLVPVLRIEPVVTAGPLAVPNALVFTSLQGVRTHRFLPTLSSVPVFAVGERSAQFARSRGYRTVFSADGNVSDLRRLIRKTMSPGSELLHLSARQPAGDLLGMLREDGFIARRRCVYEAVEVSAKDLEWLAGGLHQIDIILVHSPRAGRCVGRWLYEQDAHWTGKVVCISAAAASAFDFIPESRVAIAARPNERELMSVLQDFA